MVNLQSIFGIAIILALAVVTFISQLGVELEKEKPMARKYMFPIDVVSREKLQASGIATKPDVSHYEVRPVPQENPLLPDQQSDDPERRLPVAPLAPHRLDAYQFDSYDPRISFGMDREKVAQVLRETADRVESGEYILQSCGIMTRAQADDYVMTYLTLQFHAKKTEAAK